MAVTRDILASYRRPGAVLRRRLASAGESSALAVLMAACLLIFVSQWPRLSREAHLTGQELEPMLGGALFSWLFVMPLVLYGLAGISHLVARMLGGQGSFLGARLALFWALLAAAPLWLFWGLVGGFVGPGPALQGTGFLAFAAFVIIWLAGLVAAERPEAAA